MVVSRDPSKQILLRLQTQSPLVFHTDTAPPPNGLVRTRLHDTSLGNSASGGPCPGSHSQHSPPLSRVTYVWKSQVGCRWQLRLIQKSCLQELCLSVTLVHISRCSFASSHSKRVALQQLAVVAYWTMCFGSCLSV